MAFLKANILTTREEIFGSKWVGQIVPIPTGRIDKASLYLEPVIANIVLAQSIMVIVEIYALDGLGKPTGTPIVSDNCSLSDITVRGFFNFRLSSAVPTMVGIVVRVDGGDASNHVSWRYVNTSAGSEEMLVSTDSGSSWTLRPDRKFSYQVFSSILGAVDSENQTATIQPGTAEQTNDHTNADWTNPSYEPVLDRTTVNGDTVIVNFGDFVVTLVVDQSGSMTWNDNNGLRYTFLKQFIQDIDSSLPAGSSATYSLFKFRGRRIGKLSIGVQGSQSTGLHLDGVRVVRVNGSVPATSPYAGTVVFEGLAERYTDDTVVYGSQYSYSAFPYAVLGSPASPYYAEARTDNGWVINGAAPYCVANFIAEVIKTDSTGTEILTTAIDLGYRRVDLSWQNPAGYTYNRIVIIRRDDRPAASTTDYIDTEDVILDTSAITTSITDSYYTATPYKFVNGFTYYYTIFTISSVGIKSFLLNAQNVLAEIPVAARPWEEIPPNPVAWPVGSLPPAGWPVATVSPPIPTIEESNGEIRISWTSTAVHYRLYFNGTRFSLPLDDKGTYDGTLLYEGSDTIFTHRSLPNGEPCFYTIVAYDRVLNASTPVQPLISLEPPRPSASATVFFPPDPVTNFSAETTNGSITLTWKNPSGVATGTSFYFGDVVNIVSNVEFIDQGTSESLVTYEFIELGREVQSTTEVDANTAIVFAKVPSLNADAIIATVSVIPSLAVQNKMTSASITLKAVLRIKHKTTGEVLAQVSSEVITVVFQFPFSLTVKNDPQQMVSRRDWVTKTSDVPTACIEKEYNISGVPGVYAMSGNPFFAVLEATYRGASLGAPLDVNVSLLDPATGNPSALLVLPQTNTTTATLRLLEATDDIVDRSGNPNGQTQSTTTLPLTLPASNVSGTVRVQINGTFNNYTQTSFIDAYYEPTLNIDLNLLPYQPDDVDITEQSAFVYIAPFDAPDSQKVPVSDLTITNWSITKLCKDAPDRPLYSKEDGVVGLKSFTRGGIAQKIFWGPGKDVTDEQDYEIKVTAQANGMTGVGYGILRLGQVQSLGANKLFLRKQHGFNTDSIFSDGSSLSVWEVLGNPDLDYGPDISTGETFVNSVTANGGRVPPNGIEDGRIVTLDVAFQNNSDTGFSTDELTKILNSVRIITNLTGASGKARSAKAKMIPVSGVSKALFTISVNSRVPKSKESISESELQQNLYYGIQFGKPSSGVYLVLTAYTTIEVNGHPASFIGGGGNLVSSAPPCFIELVEPLRLA